VLVETRSKQVTEKKQTKSPCPNELNVASYQIKGIEYIFSHSPCSFKPVLSVNYYFYNTVMEFIWLREKN